MSGSGLSVADRNKKVRQDALREQLSNKGLVQQVLEISDKIGDLSQDIEKEKIDRLKIAADLKMKLVAKYLPDLKQTELIGDPDKPVEHKHSMQWNLLGVSKDANNS
jgi:hypothetical protein